MRGALVVPGLLVVILSAGCLDRDGAGGDTSVAKACSLLGGPSDVPRDAPAVAGTGPRQIQVTDVPAGDAIAVWWPDGDRLAVLHLRSAESGSSFQSPHVSGGVSISPSVAKVPAGIAVRVVAGDREWTKDGFVAAGTEDVVLSLATPAVRGSVDGTWTDAATLGPAGAAWQPTPMPWADGDTMARLESLSLGLRWDNGAGGGADFGIAVGPGASGGFHYVNGEYQATPGPQQEARVLGPADFAQLGWTNATRPQAGPSVSTGAFATTGVPYELSWEATFGPDPGLAHVCETLGDAEAVDLTSGPP